MAAARYWRLVGVQTAGGGDLELSAIALYAGGTRVDGTATLTCSHAPTAGALANLQDTDSATTTLFAGAAVRSGGFHLQWDFGSATDVAEIRIAGGSNAAKFLVGATLLQASSPGVWALAESFDGAQYPGDGVLSTSSEALSPTAWNPSDKSAGATLTDGNLGFEGTFTEACRSAFGASGGKWYWEILLRAGMYPVAVGIGTAGASLDNYVGSDGGGIGWYGDVAQFYRASVGTAYGTSSGPGEVIGVALNLDAGELSLFRNGVAMGVMVSGLTGTWHAMISGNAASLSSGLANFGGTPFTYAPPAGFLPGFGQRIQVPLTSTPAITTRYATAQRCATAAVGAHAARATPTFANARDVEFGGPGTIYGTTKTKGTTNLPTKARVVLLHQRSKQPVRETWSDPVTGAYAFAGIDTSQQFIVLAEDAAGSFRPVAANRLTPQVLP